MTSAYQFKRYSTESASTTLNYGTYTQYTGFSESTLTATGKTTVTTTYDTYTKLVGKYIVTPNGKYVYKITGAAQHYTNYTSYTFKGYWEYAGMTNVCGTFIEEVTSTNQSAYPNNAQSNNYWYKYNKSVTTYSQGTYIEDVYSPNIDTYPTNGEQDGYWYVLQD